MTAFKACVFDLDGTIVNSIEDLTASINFALAENNFPGTYSVEDVKMMVGNGIRKLVERALPVANRGETEIGNVIACFTEHYFHHCIDNSRPYAGVPEMLAYIKSRGVKLAVISNKADMLTKVIVDALFASNTFDVVRGMRDGVPPKPNPVSTLTTLKELCVLPEECLFIGDSGVDMQTARSAGCIPAGVLWGFRSKEDLELNGANYLAAVPEDLKKIITGTQK